jgi:hypothetical protein
MIIIALGHRSVGLQMRRVEAEPHLFLGFIFIFLH